MKRLPAKVEGLQVEATAPVVVQDRVLEVTWQIPIIVSNTSKRPLEVPVLKGVAHVRTSRAEYVATVTTVGTWELRDGRRLVLNPTSTLIAAATLTLPAGEVPTRLVLQQLRPRERAFSARLAVPVVLDRHPVG